MSTTIDGFESAPSRIVGERDERIAMGGRAIKFHVSFLDDVLRGILPHDLVLIGAPSGLGKTDLSLNIATSNAANGKWVHYFALEAEPRELERRTKFALLSREAFRIKHSHAAELNYADWLLGKCEHIVGEMNALVDMQILQSLGKLKTYYRGAKFDHHDLNNAIQQIHADTDLILIDHLHYIDVEDGENEAKGLGDVVKTVRDISLRIGKPIILVAHLRKRDTRAKQLVATLDDFHGSSNIVKICTQAITLDRATCVEPSKWYLSPTFINVAKDRRAGAPGLVAMAQFDRRTRSYRPEYTLGRLAKSGTEWEPLGAFEAPSWAKHHVALEGA